MNKQNQAPEQKQNKKSQLYLELENLQKRVNRTNYKIYQKGRAFTL